MLYLQTEICYRLKSYSSSHRVSHNVHKLHCISIHMDNMTPNYRTLLRFVRFLKQAHMHWTCSVNIYELFRMLSCKNSSPSFFPSLSLAKTLLLTLEKIYKWSNFYSLMNLMLLQLLHPSIVYHLKIISLLFFLLWKIFSISSSLCFSNKVVILVIYTSQLPSEIYSW